MYKFIIATGGTGGHIFPATSLLNKLTEHNHQCLIAADKRFLKFKEYIAGTPHYKIITTSSLAGGVFQKLFSLYKIAFGTLQALYIVLRYKPKMVISFGGYVSFPTMLAALMLRIPLFINEQNSVMGKANRILLRFADLVAVAFENTIGAEKVEYNKLFVTGNPVRDNIMRIKDIGYPALTNNSKIKLLILGGSQGAKILSKVIPEAITSLDAKLKKRIEVCQQCRKEDLLEVTEKYKHSQIKAEVKEFFLDIDKKLADTNLVICRSGASTVSELIAVGRPAIFVPLKIAADNHQYFNALSSRDKNAAWLIEEKDFNPKTLASLISKLIKEPKLLTLAAKNMKSQFIDSSEMLLGLIEKFCAKRQ